MTSLRCLNGKVSVRSICRSKDLDPGADLADDGIQLIALTMFCG